MRGRARDFIRDLSNHIANASEGYVFGVGALFCAAVIVFCQQAWVPGFFHDGYLYASFGKNAAELGHWLIPFQSESQYSEFNQHPPFIFVLEGLFFKLFGSGFTSARIFGAMWGVFSVVGLWSLLRIREKRAWGFFAGAVMLLMPFFIKKARFPNMDLPLTFFFLMTFFFYYQAYSIGRKGQPGTRPWLLSGLFWGFALLTKGPVAFVVPLAIFLHLIVTRNLFSMIKRAGPWLCLILGLIIFSIWPLLLWYNGRIDIFFNYITGQVLSTVVEGRGTESLNPFAYLLHLIKYSAPWVILAIVGAVIYFRDNKKRSSLYLLFCCWFLAVLVPFSLLKWKYSHYILPLYPALAALAAYPITKLSTKALKWIAYAFKRALILFTLLLLVFPITTNIRRDKELFEVVSIVEKLAVIPSNWVVIEDAYAYWNTSGLGAYMFSANPYWKDREYFREYILRGSRVPTTGPQLFFIKSGLYRTFLKKYNSKVVDRVREIISFPASDFTVLLERNYSAGFLTK